jgi:hypothetical protein
MTPILGHRLGVSQLPMQSNRSTLLTSSLLYYHIIHHTVRKIAPNDEPSLT